MPGLWRSEGAVVTQIPFGRLVLTFERTGTTHEDHRQQSRALELGEGKRKPGIAKNATLEELAR